MSLSRRHHQLIRFTALCVAASSVVYMASRARVRGDLTAEGLSRLTPSTLTLVGSIEEERPVTIHAFVSKDVPREYVAARSQLLSVLREMEARGGDGLVVRIVEPEPHSVEAEQAMENYGISPRQLVDRTGGRIRAMDVFLGVAMVSGPRTEVIPFLDRGLSVEYEINRALRVVTQEERQVVGIVQSDATIMGSFDLQSRGRQAPWQIVEELRKQYEVRSVSPKAPIPDDIDVLIVPQLPSLTQEELANVEKYVDAGRPALLTVDPSPRHDLRLAPGEPKLPPPGQQQGMFGAPPSEEKGDYEAFLRSIGVVWDDTKIVYDTENPNPGLGYLPPHIVFSTDPTGAEAFQADDPVIAGLSQVVFIEAGDLEPAPGAEAHFTPLLTTSRRSGFNSLEDLYDRHMLFGFMPRQPARPGSPIDGEQHVLAARVTTTADAAPQEGKDAEQGDAGDKAREVVVIADLDLFADVFFTMNAQGGDTDGDGLVDVRFDNVPFLLNVVDDLSGDDRFFELRRRRPAYRRLTLVDELTSKAREQRQTLVEATNAEAQAELDKAKANLEAAVATIREQTDLDETTKEVRLASAEAIENRRLQARTAEIERKTARAIDRIDRQHAREVDEVQNKLRLVAVLIPPLPALFLGAFIFWRKRRREQDAIPTRRRTGGPSRAQSPKGDAA